MEKYSNGQDHEDIESDSGDAALDPPSFSLDEIAQETDDTIIIGDNVLAHVEVRKPRAQEWFQIHPAWKLSTRAIVDKRGTREVYYLLHRQLQPWSPTLEQDSIPVLIRVGISTKGKIFVWVIKKGKEGDTQSKIYGATLEHIQKATTSWIRHFWVENERRHVMRVATIEDRPAWPEGVSFQDVIVAGFGSRLIKNENAQILRELRGEDSDV